MKLLLDDERTPKSVFLYKKDERYLHNDWVIVLNYRQFKEYILNNPMPELISFDHDLQDIHYEIEEEHWNNFTSEQLGVEETGYDCADWLVNYCVEKNIPLTNCLCHSMNIVGRNRIINRLNDYGRQRFAYEKSRE